MYHSKAGFRLLIRRLKNIARPFWVSTDRWKAYGLLSLVLLLLCGATSLNVYNAFVMGKLMTALQAMHASAFYRLIGLYAAVIIGGIPVMVYYGYLRTLLAIRWRGWLTAHITDRYLRRLAYYRLASDSEIDNPDERITQDVDTFVNTTVGLSIALCDALTTIVSFAGVLWSISVPLTLGVIVYSLIGTLITIWIGKQLVPLNFQQTKTEADMRYSVADVRRDFESIAFYRGEKRVKMAILKNLSATIRNLGTINIVNRNLSFFTTGYNGLVVLLPLAAAAPLYFSHHMEFGDLTRASIAFANICAGMSLLIGQFNGISGYAANIARLGSFIEALDKHSELPLSGRSIEVLEGSELAATNVTVLTPESTRTLVENLNFQVAPGQSLLIMGASGSGKSSVLRALAGIWINGSGRITRPNKSEIMFLPQRPHVPTGSLRAALCYPRTRAGVTDGYLLNLLKQVNLCNLPVRCQGLDCEHNWRDVLSQGEQQRLSLARVLLHAPKYAVLDEATSALDEENEKRLYDLLRASGITLVSVGHRKALLNYHDRVLTLKGDGSWTLEGTNAISRDGKDETARV
ncbi:MAG TPA: ABC transporter ATP-binding protein/permease [Planktothrix sp.]|jgi:putative ATP-binding cassette transporter